MYNTTFLLVGTLLALKHFVMDGPLQTPYQYLNKGNFKHFGGYLHAGLHGVATAAIFAFFGFWWLGLVDFVIHYCVDFGKVNLTKKYKWSGMTDKGLLITSNSYFIALMADQCLHFSTYILLIFLAKVI